ncbi:MAG: hypothetical protein ACYS0H_26930, partial [Planctomycetota bacterium]
MRVDLCSWQITLLPDKRTLILILIACANLTGVVCAQVAFQPTPIRPEPVGSGARALGQSAFIAVADDATAASWNPAGLRSLERPEASFVGAWRTTTQDYSLADDWSSSDPDRWSGAQINFMSYAQPTVVGNTHAGISVNYRQVYNFEGELNVVHRSFFWDWESERELKSKSEGAIAAYSLAGGLSVPSYPEIAIGASFNWYTQSLFNDYTWQTKATQTVSYPVFGFSDSFQSTETYDDFRGHNFTLGLLWDMYEKGGTMLTLGLVYHTPFTANVDRKATFTDSAGIR